MFETDMTVIGNVVNAPQRRVTGSGQEVISFRVGSTARYQDQESRQWRDGGSVFLNVSCWRRLIPGVGAALGKGDPVIVHGSVRNSRYTTREGVERTDVEMRASSVGLDLARCIAKRIDQRGPRVAPESEAQEVVAADADAGGDGESQDAPPAALVEQEEDADEATEPPRHGEWPSHEGGPDRRDEYGGEYVQEHAEPEEEAGLPASV